MHRESTLQRPTRIRFIVLAFVCSLSMITYLDRVCMGSAAPFLRHDLGLNSVSQLGLAFSAFALAYSIFEIPTGWLGDIFGPRKTLIRIVLWWSGFTALTGFVGMILPGELFLGLGSLVVIRFLFGMGEAGAYPNITRALHNWFPFQERGMAQGSVWMAGRLMGGLTPLLWWLLVEGITRKNESEGDLTYLVEPLFTWRQTFWFFGGIGLGWCLLFAWWFRNRPEENPSVNQAELDLIMAQRKAEEGIHRGVPWLKLFTSGNLWCLCLMYFCGAYGWYFNITYLPSFLEEQFHVDPKSMLGALYKGGPLWMGALGCLIGGWLTDSFIRRTGNRKWGRRLFGVIGHSLCALCWLSCLVAPSVFFFFLAISQAAFWNDVTMASSWATCQDIGKRYAAIVAGCMNTIGNLGGAVAGYLTAVVLDGPSYFYALNHKIPVELLTEEQKAGCLHVGWQINFVTFGLVYFLAVVLWLRVDSTRPIFSDSDQ